MKLIFLDTETHAIEQPELVQIAWLRVLDGVRTSYTKLFKPKVAITTGAAAVHQITDDMVKDCPSFTQEYANMVDEALKGVVMVAHNAQFDIEVLVRAGCKKPSYVIDTYKVAYFLLEDLDQYKLQYLRHHFKVNADARAHDAQGDVEILAKVFDKLLDLWKEKHHCDNKEAVAGMVVLSAQPILFRKFTFGKHNGKTIEEVIKTDRSYIKWLRECCDENMAYTIDHHLCHST